MPRERKHLSLLPSLGGSPVSCMYQRKPAPGSEGNRLSTPGACSLSWSLWLLHPAAAPWFGEGTGLAIPRKCLPPVQAGIPAHTLLVVVVEGRVGEGGMFPLSSSGRRSGDHLGPSPLPPPCLGNCPVQCPFHGHLPPSSCAGA